MMHTFYSNGKLLLSGEYLVLDGALSLAIPTKYGQSLTIEKLNESKLIWESYNYDSNLWLQVEFDLPKLRIISETFSFKKNSGNDSLALRLQQLLITAKKLNSKFLNTTQGYYVKTKLTFPKNWGLGSSSTLINNIAQWARIDAFALQFLVFGGSGFDIACAQYNLPILYQLKNSKPIISEINFEPPFKNQLYFVHLNKKQNSRKSIATYNRFKGNIASAVAKITSITERIVVCTDLLQFEQLLKEHEQIIASIIQQEPIQKALFPDYFGQIKSLGAWGGDFILATGNDDTPNYFKQKGFTTIISYSDMIL